MAVLSRCAPPTWARRSIPEEACEYFHAMDEWMASETEAPVRPALILVAEDDAEMRAFLGQALQEEGHEVLGAANGAELLERLESLVACGREPDLVISDVRMPGISGLELLEALRETWWLPVILITAFGDHSLHETASERGASRVLDKPFEIDYLLGTVSDVLRRAHP